MSDIYVNFEPPQPLPVNRLAAPSDDSSLESDRCQAEADQATECELMQRLSGGDEAAMSDLLKRHGEMLGRLVGRLTAWSAEHEDVFQEVLLKIWQKAGSYRGAGSLEGWLRRLAVNRCHNHLRRQNSLRRMIVRFIDFRQTNQQKETTAEPSSKLHNALKELSGNERTVLVLYYLEDMSGEEVANALGVKTESLHVRLHRARKKLKAILSNKGDV